MELNKLRELVLELRALGVKRYSYNGPTETIELELGDAPAQAPRIDFNRDGFVPNTGRSPELTAALNRLDPAYADPALFEIK